MHLNGVWHNLVSRGRGIMEVLKLLGQLHWHRGKVKVKKTRELPIASWKSVNLRLSNCMDVTQRHNTNAQGWRQAVSDVWNGWTA